MSTKKDGTPTAERKQLLMELLAERLTGDSIRHYVTPAMEFGLQYEDEAKAAYEAHTGELLIPCGVYDHPLIDMFAATPDALLGDGLAEFKVPTSPTFLGWVLAGVVPDEHTPQMIAQCACTGRKWVEFVAFDPRLRNSAKRLFVRRFVPTAEEIATIEAGATTFLAELDVMFEQFTAAAA